MALALVAVVALGAGPAWSARQATLTLSGDRTAWTDLVVTQEFTVDYDRSDFAGKGKHIGLYLDPVPADNTVNAPDLGAVRLRDFHGPDTTGYVVDLSSSRRTVVKPGRYRAFLIADGPAVVTLPISGARSYELRPRKAGYAASAQRTDIVTGPISASARAGLYVKGARSLTLSGIVFGEFRAWAGQVGACVTLPELECGEATSTGIDSGFQGYILSPLQETPFGLFLVYRPGVLKPRQYDGRQFMTAATTLKWATGAAFTLNLDA